MHKPVPDTSQHQNLIAAAVIWLLVGSALLLTTLVPAYTELLGWTPAFWLVGAPLAVLLTLEPSLPRQLLALRQPRRRRVAADAIWH